MDPIPPLTILDDVLVGPRPPLPAPVAAEAAPGRAVADVDDPGKLMLTCTNWGARMDERKCKLICRCGYFLSCSDYY